MVTLQPTLDAVIEGRNRGIKEWKFQRRAGMGQKVLEGSRSEENGKTSNTYMEYGEKIRKRVAKRTFEAHDLMLRSYYAVKFSSSSSVDFFTIAG